MNIFCIFKYLLSKSDYIETAKPFDYKIKELYILITTNSFGEANLT